MNQELTGDPVKMKVRDAEDALTRSIARFESAMERLATKVEDTSHRVQHVVDIARHQKDELVNLKNRAREAFEPVMPFIHRAGQMSSKAVRTVKANPRPYLWTVAGIVGGIIAINYFQKRNDFNGIYGEKSFSSGADMTRPTEVNFQ